ncbi:MAG: hypothetical protein RBG13Loki_3272 [Promethearchaeota archaeon CR_4]|nr:MAG: hypothetical protein RBG13Loki_3272 [Candidatus Lokiarchaeota archaeon CR_4]
MPANKVSFKVLWTRKAAKRVYACSISNLMGDENPEIIVCSFDATMRVYDLKGNELWSTEFSPEITAFIAAPITKDVGVELLSGDVNGIVRLMSKQGNLLWQVKLRSPVICVDTGDMTDDGKKEIIVGLQNQKLLVLDNMGAINGEFELPEPIVGCTVGRPAENVLAPLFVVLKSGRVISVDHTGQWQERFALKEIPTCITSLKFRSMQALAVGTKSGLLKVFDLDGNVLGENNLGEKIRCVNREIRPPRSETSMLVSVGAGERLILFEIQKITSEVEKLLEPIAASTPKMIGKPASRKVTKLLTSQPVTPVPGVIARQDSITERKGGQLEGTSYETDTGSDWKYKFCRGCGKAISPEQRQRLLDGYRSFCEVCGIPLLPSDDESI